MNKTPLWRYIFIVILLVLGVIYALPNLYGEDPAVQISLKNGAVLDSSLSSNLKDNLDSAHVAYKSIDLEKSTAWVKFANTDLQIEAQDVIRGSLGDKYVTSISLIPRTPKWLQDLGAQPMKLGLDLRGGIHFLLQVDLQSVIAHRADGDLKAMAADLRSQNIHYIAMSASHIKTATDAPVITFGFASATDEAAAQNYLAGRNRDYLFTSGDNNTCVATMGATALSELQRNAMSQNMTTLTNRVNALGISEATVQRQGINQISLDLPGIQDTARAKQLIGKVATLQFKLVDTENDAFKAQQTGVVPFGSQLFNFSGRPILLKNQVILSGDSITSASSAMDQNGRPSVSVRVGSGVGYFHQVTGQNVGNQMAVVYNEVVSTPMQIKGKTVISRKKISKLISVATIQQALANDFQITGLDSMRYASDLALQLRSGAYTAPVEIVQNMTVGPTMGAENIRNGVLSTVVGSLLIFLFMAIYYRTFGLVADIALLLNTVFIVAVLSILGATLTLPGIAGIVLTIGMAVDANVLINERIREELRNGVNPLAAISAGYDRAFITIVDANVTTLIVAVVLFTVSSTSIKSFAINLMIGLLTSMFTAIFFTRAIINLIYSGKRVIKRLSIGI
jgi:preprotein translocase subunit SecD